MTRRSPSLDLAALAATLLVLILPTHAGATEPSPEPISLEFRLASEVAVDGWAEKAGPAEAGPLFVAPEVVISGTDVERAWYEPMQRGHAVGILLTESAGLRLARFSRQHVGERVAILVDDRVVAAPRIRAEISGGRALVHGRFSEAEARTIAEALTPDRPSPAP
jgi:preprotein translocase subunit SecD